MLEINQMTNNITHSFLTPQQQFGISGNCGIQCHILWDLGEASALHTDLDPDYGHCSGLEPAGEHCLRQSTMDKRAVVEVHKGFQQKSFQHTV